MAAPSWRESGRLFRYEMTHLVHIAPLRATIVQRTQFPIRKGVHVSVFPSVLITVQFPVEIYSMTYNIYKLPRLPN